MLYMARASREVWLRRIERFRDSGLTAAEFAAEIGVNVNTLKNWIWRVSSEAKPAEAACGAEQRTVSAATESKRSRKSASRRASPMVEVVGALPTPPSAGYELALPSGVSLRLPTDFEIERVRALVALATEVR